MRLMYEMTELLSCEEVTFIHTTVFWMLWKVPAKHIVQTYSITYCYSCIYSQRAKVIDLMLNWLFSTLRQRCFNVKSIIFATYDSYGTKRIFKRTVHPQINIPATCIVDAKSFFLLSKQLNLSHLLFGEFNEKHCKLYEKDSIYFVFHMFYTNNGMMVHFLFLAEFSLLCHIREVYHELSTLALSTTIWTYPTNVYFYINVTFVTSDSFCLAVLLFWTCTRSIFLVNFCLVWPSTVPLFLCSWQVVPSGGVDTKLTTCPYSAVH